MLLSKSPSGPRSNFCRTSLILLGGIGLLLLSACSPPPTVDQILADCQSVDDVAGSSATLKTLPVTSIDEDSSRALNIELQSPKARLVVINEDNSAALEQLAAAPSDCRCLVLIFPHTPEETAREVAQRFDGEDFRAADGGGQPFGRAQYNTPVLGSTELHVLVTWDNH